MSKRNKVHMLEHESDGIAVSQCNMIAVSCTTDQAEVTCGLCKRLLGKYGRPPDRTPGGEYSVVPQTWDARGQAIIDALKAGRRERRYRWPDIESALREYCATIVDGYGAKSWAASIARYGQYGTLIAVSGGVLYNEPADRAEGAAMVDKALRWTLRHAKQPRIERAVILLKLVGVPVVDKEYRRHGIRAWFPWKVVQIADVTGLESDRVREVIRWGRRYLKIDLGARGLVPIHPRDAVDASARRRALRRG